MLTPLQNFVAYATKFCRCRPLALASFFVVHSALAGPEAGNRKSEVAPLAALRAPASELRPLAKEGAEEQGATQAASPGTAAIPKSSFSIPAKPQDGHDPFFPASDRLFAVKTAPKAATASTTAALVFNGKSGTQERPFAMINGYTFAAGEEALVNTSSGRVRVRCVEIKGGSVVVEVAGERRELHFEDR